MGQGFIREEKDVKYLILFALQFFPVAISESDLLEVVLIDDAFGYFEFSAAFQQLLQSKHVAAVDDGTQKKYFLTPSGGEAIETLAHELPASVRDKAEKAALGVISKLRRDASIKTGHRDNGDGTFTVQLKICDKHSDQLSVELLAVTKRQCDLVEDNFHRNAENIYREILLLLSGNGKVQ